jgi:hypothetical protein
MGSFGFIVLGLATLAAVTCIILKLLNMDERAAERDHTVKVRECEREDQ